MIDSPSVRQQRLAILTRALSGPIHVDEAAKVLGLGHTHTAKLLAGWHKQGVIRRVARGLYIPIPPSALGQVQVLEDPWVLVPELYAPGYVGGWSALEYWELTEQLFRSVCVLTGKRTTYGELALQGVNFFVSHVPVKHIFGTKTIWRNNIKVQISDPQKTILDIVDDPKLGAGLRHVVDCLSEFKKIYTKPEDLDRFLDYAKKIDNGALFKKLGFLSERLGFEKSFIDECARRLTTGYAYLDRSSENNKLITKWRLWVPRGYDA